MKNHHIVQAITAGTQIEGQRSGQGLTKGQQVFLGKSAKTGKCSIGAFFCTAAPQDRLRHAGQLRQACGKVTALLQRTGRADSRAEQTAAAVVRIDDEKPILRHRPVRTNPDATIATAVAEAHFQTAGRLQLQIIPATGIGSLFSHYSHPSMRHNPQ